MAAAAPGSSLAAELGLSPAAHRLLFGADRCVLRGARSGVDGGRGHRLMWRGSAPPAGQAEQAGMVARATAAAYELAFAMTVPRRWSLPTARCWWRWSRPTSSRRLAIAATEVQYAEMWPKTLPLQMPMWAPRQSPRSCPPRASDYQPCRAVG